MGREHGEEQPRNRQGQAAQAQPRKEEEALASLPPEIEKELVALSASSPTREICGLILMYPGDVIAVVRITNDHSRDDKFNMKHDELLEVYRNSYKQIIGVFHSHWNGQRHPSDADEMYANPAWRYFIVTLDEVVEWEFRDGGCREVGSKAAGQDVAG